MIEDKLFTPETYKEARECDDNEKWTAAEEEEMTSIEEREVYI